MGDGVVEGALGGVLGQGYFWSDWPQEFDETDGSTLGLIEESFGAAGWYSGNAEPYEPPTVLFSAPPDPQAPIVEAIRRVWLGRWNPAAYDLNSADIDDDSSFPWLDPSLSPKTGWWLSTKATPKGRYSIEAVAAGDLVVCQRSNPGKSWNPDHAYTSAMLVGVCVVGLVDAWNDSTTGLRERAVCLIPLTKFDYPVPVPTAKARHRLKRPSFSSPLQRPGRLGPKSFGLAVVEWEDAVELLSVCGIPPDTLAEPDTAVLAARLKASVTGNRALLELRYDAVLQQQLRRRHELAAEDRAEAWAAAHGYPTRQRFQHVALAGFDLLAIDGEGGRLQIEIKGYSSTKLASVHLQPSQALRAVDAAEGNPPPWKLFALLGIDSDSPSERIIDAAEVVKLLDSGGIKVKGGWPTKK
jgi:hypothetical protein